MTTRPVVFWFRRDLRTSDHPALQAAAAAGPVLPVFVLDPHLLSRSGAPRRAYLKACLRALGVDVPLVVRAGPPVEALSVLIAESSATAVYATEDFGPYGRARDASVAARLNSLGVAFERVGSPYLVAPGTVRKPDGAPYRVFTPFYRAWSEKAQSEKAWSERANASTEQAVARWHLGPRSDPIAAMTADVPVGLPEAGERAALDRLERFATQRVARYHEERDRPDLDSTSRLSSDLKFGVLHPRQVLAALGPLDKGREVFRKEIGWREFYADVLFHQPGSARQALQPKMEAMRCDAGPVAEARFGAWCTGRTGYPFVDAGMRQLLAEGWMHNRVRMVVASFLVKDLHLDWRVGARHFMRHLIDGDLASNQHGWQWTAGTGTDAAPYFRVFNPVSQGRKFDPDGHYVRRWIPELADIRGGAVHEPHAEAELGLLEGLGDGSGRGAYPSPIVDHGAERDEALTRYSEVRADAVVDDRRSS